MSILDIWRFDTFYQGFFVCLDFFCLIDKKFHFHQLSEKVFHVHGTRVGRISNEFLNNANPFESSVTNERTKCSIDFSKINKILVVQFTENILNQVRKSQRKNLHDWMLNQYYILPGILVGKKRKASIHSGVFPMDLILLQISLAPPTYLIITL